MKFPNFIKINPLPQDTPSWVEKIKSFEKFKQRWDEARAFNDKYKTTEDAWKAYKVRNDTKNLNFSEKQ